ncbi:MAG TPA: TetR/AcrR family transcriptional regulator [Propionicimonas sp.]|uniref:TetR/AcrR family transcriptional regulator n=1 Tax=Propionicimonas sp. TaxID=1955623 RepID=UPI002F407AD2
MTGTRGNYAAGAARREQILESATLHFARNGYHRTTMASIAKDVGITTAGLMHHFPGKQELLLALAEHRFSLLAGWAAEGPVDHDGLGFWRTTVRLTERMVAKPGLIELFLLVAFESVDPSSPVHGLYARRYVEGVHRAASHWQAGIDRGIFRPDIDCEAFGRQCIAVTDGLQLQWALSDGALDLAASIRDHHERLIRTAVLPGIVVDLGAAPAAKASAK